ncbi:MAG TPA: hypothetical protein VGG25_20720 [Streptosporangiaceae bacterium]
MTFGEHDRVTRLERQVSYLLQHLGIDPEQAAGAAPAGSVFGSPADVFSPPQAGQAQAGSPIGGGQYPPELVSLVQQRKLIPAIKMYREMTGLGLKDAKDDMEDLDRQLRGR